MGLKTHISDNPDTGSYQIQKMLDSQLINLDKLLADPTIDHSRVLEQALRVIMLMSKLLGNMDKKYVIDNETEVYAKVKDLKGTYNTWSVLVITIASGALTAGGGLVKMGSIVPGSTLGTFASSKAPNILGWLGNAGWQDKLRTFGDAASGFGQGTGTFGTLFNNANEAKRAVCQVMLEEVKRKRSDRDDGARQKRNEMDSASSNCRDVIRQSHNAAQEVLRGRG